MTRWFVRLMVITISVQFVVYAVRPVLSYQAIAQGAGAAELGIITASFSVLSLLSAVPLGRAIDRWGERPFALAGCVLLTSVLLALLFGSSLVALAVCSAGLGLGHLGAVVGAQTLIAKGSTPELRDSRFAMFTTLNSVGQLLGPVATGIIVGNVAITATREADLDRVPNLWGVVAVTGAVGLASVAAAASLIARPGALSGRPLPPRTRAQGSLAAVLRVPSMPTAMLSSLTVLSTLDLLAAYLPAYGEANGISVRSIAFMLAVMGAAGLVVRLFMLRLIRLFTRRRLLALSMILASVGMAAIPLFESEWLLYLDMVVVGAGLGLGQPITLAWVAGQAPREIRGTAMSVRLSGNRLGQTAVPVLVGALAGASGLAAAFVAPATLLFVGGVLVLRVGTGNEDVMTG